MVNAAKAPSEARTEGEPTDAVESSIKGVDTDHQQGFPRRMYSFLQRNLKVRKVYGILFYNFSGNCVITIATQLVLYIHGKHILQEREQKSFII